MPQHRLPAHLERGRVRPPRARRSVVTWEPEKRLLTIEECAASIDRPVSTVRRWVSEGRIKPYATWQGRYLYLESHLLHAEARARRREGVSATRDNQRTSTPATLERPGADRPRGGRCEEP
ncbi:MAG: helix-turn-helix domain-containing protein [Motilibacteraceae bacterium]